VLLLLLLLLLLGWLDTGVCGGPAAAVSGRQARQRRAVRYDYDEYDRSMKVRE